MQSVSGIWKNILQWKFVENKIYLALEKIEICCYANLLKDAVMDLCL